MRELSEEARAVLRDFILVFDLDGFFKGSTEITEAEGAQVLEYMTSMFDFAGLPIPTTWMSAKGLKESSKALRSSKQNHSRPGPTIIRDYSRRPRPGRANAPGYGGSAPGLRPPCEAD